MASIGHTATEFEAAPFVPYILEVYNSFLMTTLTPRLRGGRLHPRLSPGQALSRQGKGDCGVSLLGVYAFCNRHGEMIVVNRKSG